MTMRLKWIISATVSIPALALVSAPAFAQDGTEESIVVTARTFAEKLQDIPNSISVVGAEQLDRQGIRSLNDVAEKTAGFSFEDFSGAVQQPSIRGQINLRSTSPVQNVATYIDGIYLQRGYLIDQSITELDRIEIIKGPQSALYGRNAFAGVVNLNSRRPDLQNFHGNVSGTIGTDELYEASAWLSVPLIPGKLAVLGSVAHSQFDGTWKNAHPLANAAGASTKGNVGGYNKESYQVRVIAKPIDILEVDALYIHTDRFQEGPATYQAQTAGLTSSVNSMNCSPVAGANRLYCGELTVMPTLAAGETRQPGITIDPRVVGRRGPTDIASGKITLDPDGPLKFTYQLGYVSGKQETWNSSNRDPLASVISGGVNYGVIFDASGTDSTFKSWSHDFRISYEESGLRAFAGATYSSVSDVESNASLYGPVGSLSLTNVSSALFPVGPGLPFPSGVYQRRTYLQTEEQIWGFYGFLDYAFTDKLNVSVEGRYTLEDRLARDFLTRDTANTTLQAATPPVQTADASFFAPRMNITYKIAPDNMVYASVARGVKSGGFNGFVPYIPQRTYKPETNWTYEVGTKNVFSDIGLTLNGSLFYTDWKDVQTNAGRLNADGTPFISAFIVSTVTGNIGNVKVYGGDIDGVWKITRNVAFDFGIAYNHARYAKGQTSGRFGVSGNCDGIVCSNASALPIGGNQVERIPEIDGFAGLGYTGSLGDNGSFYVRGDVTYQSKTYVDEANLAWVGDRLLSNAQAGFDIGGFSVNLWVKNLFDKKYVASSFFLIGTSGVRTASYAPFLGNRRTSGLQVSYKF